MERVAARTEEEMITETLETFPNEEPDTQHTVCDDCFESIKHDQTSRPCAGNQALYL